MKLENEETKTVKQFIVIFLIVLVIVGAIYLLTSKVVKKDDNTTSSNDSGNVSNRSNSGHCWYYAKKRYGYLLCSFV